LVNGPEMSRENQNRTFEPFSATESVGEGTGMGLNSAREIVIGKYDDHVRVDSRPGKTRFIVRLPLDLNKGTEDRLGDRKKFA
jgi:signal transduction histidine kinase